VIVLDASAVVELILGTPAGHLIADRIADPHVGLHAPHLIDVEVAQALRRYVRAHDIDDDEGGLALGALQELDLQRHAHEPLLERVWELRENLTAYDAVYVALAEVLDAPLITCDAPLSRAPAAAGLAELIVPS